MDSSGRPIYRLALLNIEEQEVTLLTWGEHFHPAVLTKVTRLSHASERIQENAALCENPNLGETLTMSHLVV